MPTACNVNLEPSHAAHYLPDTLGRGRVMNWQIATAITFFGSAFLYPLHEPSGYIAGLAFCGCFFMWVRNP